VQQGLAFGNFCTGVSEPGVGLVSGCIVCFVYWRGVGVVVGAEGWVGADVVR
jgi:hypothetical protein